VYYQQNLRVQLQQRRNRLYKATYQTYQSELNYLFDFLNRSPYIRGMLTELECSSPITFAMWKEEHLGWLQFEPPGQEHEWAKVCYELLLDSLQTGPGKYAGLVSSEKDYNASLRDLTEIIVDPFINYLHDRIDEGSSILYVLEKYKHKVEWFQRELLFSCYEADTAHGEQNLDTHLREYLFDQGIEYPFSEPRSPSGKADIVAGLDKPEPLVLEIKLFDPEKGYDRGYIRKGFRQAYDYAADYNKSIGYLVIFNLSNYNLVLTTKSEAKSWPPRIQLDNKTFFLVAIDLHLHEQPASKRRKLKPYEITEDYLIED
jgi:hypothetical protein